MTRTTEIVFKPVDFDKIDIIAIEREARRLRAQAFASMVSQAWSWVVSRVRKPVVSQEGVHDRSAQA